jgi:hypothetical protein
LNDATWLELSDRSNLDGMALAFVLGKLSPDLTSHDFITLPASCRLLCMDQAVRMMMLVSMPLIDDVGIAMIHRAN